jgi:hypothetical protein
MKRRYLNIPIPMLKELHINRKKFYEEVFNVGTYLYSKTLKGSEEECYRDALKFLGFTEGNISFDIMNAKDVLNRLPQKYPFVGIEIHILFDYYKNEKDDFDIVCLGSFLGIKSILGKKTYCKTNKGLIHARMFGYSSVKEVPKQLTPIQLKYQIRWHMDKVLLKLQMNWYLTVVSDHNRGMYISFNMSLEQLTIAIESLKVQKSVHRFKEMKRKTIENTKAEFIVFSTTS